MATFDSQRRSVFVGNIPYDATEEQLIQICEEVGPVVSFRLVTDRETGKPKGYGFCEYRDEETSLSARRNLQGYKINGRKLRVDFAGNDKNSDRNREQECGGSGMVANADPKMHIGGPAVPVDSALQQPLGMQVAMTAAAVMAGALGASQSGNSFNTSGVDPLTLHMSKLSRSHLNDVMSEFKAMCTQNKEQTRQLLLAIPNLSKALFQAQLIQGMVTQSMLQTPNIQQAQLQSLLLDSQQLPTRPLPGLPPLPPRFLPKARPQIPSAQPGQNQGLQSMLTTPCGILPAIQPQVVVSMNPPVQGNPSSVFGILDNTNNSSLITRPAYPSGLPEKKRPAANNLHLPSPLSKMTRINDGISYPMLDAPLPTPQLGPSTQVSAPGQTSNTNNQASQVQLPSDVESALLQQILSLTPEQLTSLPPDQQQQVIQLQQRFR